MRDPGYQIRKGYVTALAGQITLNSAIVPVLDNVPSGQATPYIALSEQTSNDSKSAKACRIHDTTILIDIVTAYQLDAGGKKDSDLIADQILQILIPDPDSNGKRAYLPLEDFRISSAKLDSSITLKELTPKEIIYRRLLRIRNTVA